MVTKSLRQLMVTVIFGLNLLQAQFLLNGSQSSSNCRVPEVGWLSDMLCDMAATWLSALVVKHNRNLTNLLTTLFDFCHMNLVSMVQVTARNGRAQCREMSPDRSRTVPQALRIRVPFQVMGGKERAVVTAGLAKLNAILKTAGSNGEEIALQPAKFFAKRRLWTDAIQQVNSVKKPSAQLQQVVQEIEKGTCQSKQ